MSNIADYTHVNFGRNRRTAAIVIGIYVVLVAAIILIDAAWWLMAFVALFTLPALWDLYANRSAGVRISDTTLFWFSGKRKAEVALTEIDHMRFDTRLDFSVRVSAVLNDRQRVRLPYDALPPHQEFEKAFQSREVKTQRHHFALF
jgi:hypothetical protein